MNELSDYISTSVAELCSRHDWLIPKTIPLFRLYDECDDIDEASLISEMLGHFFMIREPERYEGYHGMARYIKSVYIPDKTLIVAMTRDSDADSGQKVLNEIRTFIAMQKIRNVTYLNRFDALSPKKHLKYENIIIVDEFLGSGKTARKRVEDTRKTLTHVRQVHLCLLAGMGSSVRHVRHSLTSEDRIYCHYQLKKGIRENYRGEGLVERTRTMIRLEKILSPVIGTKELKEYSFGYGNAQSLVAFGDYNIPNSVFPIFWWPNDDHSRDTLFIRIEDGIN